MVKEDYYETLGVNNSASDGELKSAYRKQAMKYHPDRNKGNKESEKQFKKVNEAYYILRDKEKRAQYDQSGHQAFEGNGGAVLKILILDLVFQIFLKKCSVILMMVSAASLVKVEEEVEKQIRRNMVMI